MSESFKALVLNQEGENFNREIKSIDKISKVVEAFGQIQGEPYFPFIYSHLYLPNSNTTLSVTKDV